MSDAQFDPIPPPTYHPECSLLWAATSEMEQSSTRIPPAADAMNDARRMRVPIQDFRVRLAGAVCQWGKDPPM